MTQRRITKKEFCEEFTENDIKKNNDIKMIIDKMTMMGKGETTSRHLYTPSKTHVTYKEEKNQVVCRFFFHLLLVTMC